MPAIVNNLGDLAIKTERRLNFLSSRFLKMSQKFNVQSSISSTAYREFYISMLWQTWCSFSRSLILSSFSGCNTTSGTITSPSATWTSVERIAYEIKQAAYGKNINSQGMIHQLRNEITWGDVNRVDIGVTALQPTNFQQLNKAYRHDIESIKHLQLVRNACAHWNNETTNDIRAFLSKYTGTKFHHPSDIVFWERGSDGLMTYLAWVEDIKNTVNTAVQ